MADSGWSTWISESVRAAYETVAGEGGASAAAGGGGGGGPGGRGPGGEGVAQADFDSLAATTTLSSASATAASTQFGAVDESEVRYCRRVGGLGEQGRGWGGGQRRGGDGGGGRWQRERVDPLAMCCPPRRAVLWHVCTARRERGWLVSVRGRHGSVGIRARGPRHSHSCVLWRGLSPADWGVDGTWLVAGVSRPSWPSLRLLMAVRLPRRPRLLPRPPTDTTPWNAWCLLSPSQPLVRWHLSCT